MNKTAKKHLDAIDSGMITKTNVIGIRKLLNSLWRQERRYSTSCTSPKASFADADEIVAVIHKMKPIVTGDFQEFKTGSSPLHYPIYRAIALNGDSFDFYNIPWQSGGNGPELLGSV